MAFGASYLLNEQTNRRIDRLGWLKTVCVRCSFRHWILIGEIASLCKCKRVFASAHASTKAASKENEKCREKTNRGIKNVAGKMRAYFLWFIQHFSFDIFTMPHRCNVSSINCSMLLLMSWFHYVVFFRWKNSEQWIKMYSESLNEQRIN